MRKTIARVPILGPAVIDLARSLRDPATERLVAADLAATTAGLGWLREAMPRPAADAKRLLIVSLTDMVYQLKIEAMLGAGLKLVGWRPVVLTNSRTNTRAIRYFRAFGIEDFIYLDEFAATEAERRRCTAEAEALLAGDLSFQSVKAWVFRQSWIGPQILSTVSRSKFDGAPDPTDPGTRAEIAALLPTLLQRVIVAERVVRSVGADLGLVNEANYALYGPLIDSLIGAGTPVVQATQPWRDDALTFKRLTRETRRIHPSSIAPATFRALHEHPFTAKENAALDQLFADRYSGKWFLQSRNQPGTHDADAAAIRARFALDPTKKTATVFSHVLWDANLFYGEDLFENYGAWFVATVRAATANPNLNWLVKLHPANLWKRAREAAEGEYSELRLIAAQIGELPRHVTLVAPDNDIASLSLFQFTDYGITVRGTSGMELPCFGKPVLTAGTGRYSGLGFTDDSATADEYLGRLATLHLRGPLSPAETELGRRHAHAAFLRRPWLMTSFKSSFAYEKRGTAPLDHNLECTVENLAGLQRNGDLARWADWAASHDIDYLEPV
ncbi:MAG: hypothetical protein JWL84_435 [Rhodospirillales bacterium]|nr:hypothetical protein [Rhodospirillales bacterium]